MSQNTFLNEYNRRMGLPEDYVHGQKEQPEKTFSPLAAPQDVSVAETVDPDAITDMGDIETLDISTPDAPKPGTMLPADTIVSTMAAQKAMTDNRAAFEEESLPQTLHALHNSLNLNPYGLKDLSDRAGLTYSVVDADSGFAKKKIASDRYAELLRGFMENVNQTPKTAEFLRQDADVVEQLALTSDVALSALEKDIDPSQLGFFESGYIGAARNAWENGLLSREIGELSIKWMNDAITDEERSRLDVLRQAEAYYQKRRESLGLLERMVRGTVEALGVPLYGGVKGAVEFLGRYGKEGLAGGAMVGAGIGSAAGGAGAAPGAVVGGLAGLSTVAQAGFVNDMMRQEGAQTFLSLMDMGVPEKTARVLAIAAGGAKGLLEYVGLREVGKVFPGAERFLTREAATAALNTLKRNPSIAAALGDAGLAALRGIAGETGTEMLQESVDIAAEEAGRRLSGVNKAAPTLGEIGARLFDTAIQTIESTALVGGVGGAARGARHYAVANRRESLLAELQDNQSRTLDTVANAVQNSPVMKDMTGTGEALLQHLSDNGVTPQAVYIKPEAVQQIFFQEENPELMAVAADMGITPESLQENLTLGTDVAVDFAKAAKNIMQDPQRYAALKPDMRLEPSMMTDAEVEQLSAMTQDAEARLAYLDNLLAPLTEEVNAAQSRYDQRMEIAKPYVEQLRQAGYTDNQANAYGLVLAANAERMAEVFGMTPQEYLAQRFAGYHSMTQEEFERLAAGGLEGLFENRELASMLQDMGVTKGMSRSRKRRQLQPEFDYVYGRIDAESVKNLYGQERVNELRRMFGPGFFAKKGEGTPLDVLAQTFAREERGGNDLGAEEIDADAFAEKIFAPHDEFEAGLAGQLRQQMLYQFIGEQGAARLDAAQEATTRLDNLAVARDMEAAGKDAKAIKMATGWERGADGKWRYEIDDVTLNDSWLEEHFRDDGEGKGHAVGFFLSDAINEEIATAYPQTQETEIFIEINPTLASTEAAYSEAKEDSGNGDYYDGHNAGIRISAQNMNEAKLALKHEIQHLIQDAEGFARGGSPEGMESVFARAEAYKKSLPVLREFQKERESNPQATPEEIAHSVRDSYRKTGELLGIADNAAQYEREISFAEALLNDGTFEKIYGITSGFMDDMPNWMLLKRHQNFFEAYKSLAGEVEARNVERRSGMTTAERLASLASETEDVAREDQILLRDGLQAAAMAESQKQTSMGPVAQEKLARDVAAWKKSVEKLEKGTLNTRKEMTMLSQTPLVMQLVGARNLPVKIAPGKLKKAMEKHGLSYDVVRKIPAALTDPIMIFASATHRGDLLMMLDIKDREQNGATVNVPIALALKDSGGYEANIATTAFGRRKDSTGLPDNKWFVSQVENGNLLYRNNKKSRDWARTSKVQFLGANSRAITARNKIRTEADLVNLLQQNPTLYQTAYHGTPHRFDKFTLDHMGEGEGAQAHGWGLYFAQNKDVSDKYRLMLTGSEVRTEVNGHTIEPNSRTFVLREMAAQAAHIVAKEKTKTGENLFPRVIASMREEITRLQRDIEARKKSFHEDIQKLEDAFKDNKTDANGFVSINGERYRSVNDYINDVEHKNGRDRGIIDDNKIVLEGAEGYSVSLVAETPGQVFAVDIPENDVLLDEDKKLKDQPKAVQEALRKLWTEALGYDAPTNKPHDMFFAYDGGRFYRELAAELGSAEAASRALNAAGVKGITYDGHRDGRCFVVFDDQAINILDTFYQNPALFSGEAGRARGAMSRLQDGRAVVGLFKSKNASTVLHETAHFWLEELREASQLPTAPDWVRDAWAKLQKAYGFDGMLDGLDYVSRWTEVQERFARDFEAYAREGKAPSWELQSAFQRFRNWLTDIYRSIKSLLGMNDLSEDVRQVFDSLLATQEEIEQSQRAVTGDSVMELMGEEVSPELKDKYARAAQKAYENASAVIANRRLVDRRAAEKMIREQVTADIDGSATYQMIARLREDGLDFEALKAAISEDVAYRLRDKWRAARGEGKALIRKGGTLDLLDVAAQFDQNDVQGLAGALLDTPTRREAIDVEVEQRLAQWDAQYDAEVEYSNAWDEALAVELEALTGQRQMSPAQLRRQMDERTGVKKMSAVDAEYKALKARLHSDERVARRAWNAATREATREANAQSREKLAALKEQERLRRAALGAAYRARIERDNIIRQLRKIGNSKSVPYDYMCQIRRLLQRWSGLGTEGQRLDPATLRGLPSLQEFLAQKSQDTLFEDALSVPEWMLSDQTGRFSDLTLEQMRDVKRLIKELAHLGRNEGKMLADKEKREIKAVADECAAAANQLSARDYISDRAGVLDTIKGALRKGLSSLTSVRFLARALDGFQDHGVNHDAWLMPLQQARTDELILQREMEEKLREALKPLLRSGQMQKAFSIDGVPLMQDVDRQWAGMWDMDKVYSVALNMGNEGNLKALMQGYGWSEADLQAITSRLTAEEWQAVQAVWDTIDLLYPRLNEVYQTLKGVPLPKVKAQAFSVQTADGQVVRLKGGYYPLIFDQRLSDKAAENQSVDELLNGMEAVLRSPNPKSGFTKERKGGTLPPKLSLTVLDRHVTDTVHYVTHALPLRDTMRLFREPSFKEAFVRAAGQENYDQLLPWLRGIARPGGEQAQGIVKAIDWLARRGSLYALGLNMKSALLQLTSIGNSWSEVGFGNFLRASATMLSAPQESWNTVRQKSAYMQNRSRLLDDTLRREYEEMQGRGVRGLQFGGRRFSLDVVRQAQMSLMIAMDAAVAYPTWLAAYDKAIARGVDEARAVAEADGAVVAAQGGGGPLDTPAVMRQAGLMRALCPFMSFALSDFNRKMETIRGFAEWAKTRHSSVTPARLFRDFALQWVLPVTLTVLMVSLGRDGEPPEGEDFLWEALTFYTMGVPIARDVAKQAESYFSSEGYKGGRSPLMLAGLDNAVRGLGHAYKAWDEGSEDAEYRAMKELLNSVGFALGLGTPQIWRTIEGTEAYWVDGEGGPLAPLLGKPRN